MKNSKLFSCLVVLLCICIIPGVNAQKLKDFSLKKAKDKLKEMVEETNTTEESTQNSESNKSSEKTLNKRLSKSEILQTMDDAQSAVNQKDYSDARFSLQQALVEIELQLGEKVLDAMPKEVNGQTYNPDEDLVLSTGVGFVGLEIVREYPSNNGDIQAMIGNNAMILAPYTMALSNPQYMSQNENMKSVRVQGKKGVLELSGDEYKLAIPFGQSSVFMLSCESCSNENDVIDLAGKFDLDKYLDILGEAPINIDEN